MSRVSPSVPAASLKVSGMLAVVGGFLDGFTYVGHGKVFANAMSGNAILFSAYCFIGTWGTALKYLPPIAAFLSAVWVVRAMHVFAERRATTTPYRTVLILEILVLTVLSCLPANAADVLFTTSIAFVAALQMQTFREVNGRAYSSTFTTGNLRTLGEAVFIWLFEGRSTDAARVARDFGVIVAAFLLGAIGGGATTKAFGNRALWCGIAFLAAVALSIGGFRFRLESRIAPSQPPLGAGATSSEPRP